MKCPKIKICDVRTTEIAEFCRDNGVDFIGLHQIYEPITPDEILNFQKIKKASGNMGVVLVTKIKNIDVLVQIAKDVPIDYIQLHFSTTKDFIIDLKKRLFEKTGKEIGIIAVFQSNQKDYDYVRSIAKISDFILFDTSLRGGTGQLSSNETLSLIESNCKHFDYFIAGGLNENNVSKVMQITEPYALDVQSGVESQKHVKDKDKIISFISAVHGSMNK